MVGGLAHTEFDLDTDKDARPVAANASLDLDQVEANTKANATISAPYRELKERVESSPTIASPTPTYPPSDGEEAKHAEFAQKRHKHYGNEAQALKQALARGD